MLAKVETVRGNLDIVIPESGDWFFLYGTPDALWDGLGRTYYPMKMKILYEIDAASSEFNILKVRTPIYVLKYLGEETMIFQRV